MIPRPPGNPCPMAVSPLWISTGTPMSIEALYNGSQIGSLAGKPPLTLPNDAKTYETRFRRDRTFVLFDGILAKPRVERQPVTEDPVAMLALNRESIVV